MALIVSESGTPGSKAIVFLHGAGLSGRQWEPQFSALTEFHMLAPDLPGNGRSPGPIDLDETVEQLAATLQERIPGGKAMLVGNSFGGTLALTLLKRHPACVERVLVSGMSAELSAGMARLMDYSGALYRFLNPDWLVGSGLKQFRIPPQYHAGFREDMRRVMTPEANQQLVSALRQFASPREAQVPVLVAVGSLETVPAKRAARDLVRTIPTARGVTVPGVGHVWNLEAPDRFNALVRAWATALPLPADLIPLR
jgi:pimeloyl-ACP methyl ester carboxylesterase